MTRADMFHRHCGGHYTDWLPRHRRIFADRIEEDSAIMHRITKRVEIEAKSSEMLSGFKRIERRDDRVFREAAGQLTYAGGVATQVSTTATAVAAMT